MSSANDSQPASSPMVHIPRRWWGRTWLRMEPRGSPQHTSFHIVSDPSLVAGVVQPVTNLLCSTGMWTHSTCVIMKDHVTRLAEGQLHRAGGDSTSLRESPQLCLALQDCFVWVPTCPEALLPFSPASTSQPPLQAHSQLPLASLQ